MSDNSKISCSCGCAGCLVEIVGILGLLFLWFHRVEIWKLVTGK